MITAVRTRMRDPGLIAAPSIDPATVWVTYEYVAAAKAAPNLRTVLTERTPEARRVLQALLPDRSQFSGFEREGVRGYEFVGTGTYGGLLAGYTSPTSDGGPNGI